MSHRPNCSGSSQRQNSTARKNPINRCTTLKASKINTLSASVSAPGGVGGTGHSGLSRGKGMTRD